MNNFNSERNMCERPHDYLTKMTREVCEQDNLKITYSINGR